MQVGGFALIPLDTLADHRDALTAIYGRRHRRRLRDALTTWFGPRSHG